MYVRTSTDHQSLDQQHDALAAAHLEPDRALRDRLSGSAVTERPAPAEALLAGEQHFVLRRVNGVAAGTPDRGLRGGERIEVLRARAAGAGAGGGGPADRGGARVARSGGQGARYDATCNPKLSLHQRAQLAV